jgi:hypothetical protein
MPTQSHGSRSKVKAVAPAIPLAIALLHGAVLTAPRSQGEESLTSQVAPAVCEDGLEDYLACHSTYPTGCSQSGKYDPYLNLFKNQTSWKNTQVQEWFTSLSELQTLEGKLPGGLGKSNHGDYLKELSSLGEGKINGIVGYLYSVKAEGKESSNCQLDDDADHENVDFHIYIGFDSSLAGRIRSGTTTSDDKKQINPNSVIVEMTPQYRGQVHPEWTLAAVQQHLGEQVRVEGQLMVDNEHYLASQDCGRSDATDKCWRGTVWELHPITDFKVCASSSCDEAGSGWKDIGTESSSNRDSNLSPSK